MSKDDNLVYIKVAGVFIHLRGDQVGNACLVPHRAI